jgi:2-polyprenyl-3-methyl-5-hydroxy-6-metoxy-1,4-benzoquinol methylase
VHEPSLDAWPESGLERVHACPACGATVRELLHERVTDQMFRCAPGAWTSWRCRGCGSAYLDPRPTRETVGLAYSEYFTHEDGTVERPGGLRAALANGYLNARYGTALQPAAAIGRAVVPLFPVRRARTDREVRHLRLRPGSTVLDVGCGNGEFLVQARRAGWRAFGVDADPQAVATCRRGGLDADFGTIESVDANAFDAITFGHVLEHLHDPRGALRHAQELLSPGGLLWVATPNADAAGHARFGADWLGLDAPRHLVVFSRRALDDAVTVAGLEVVARPTASFTRWIYDASARVAHARIRAARFADVRATLQPARAEELIVLARKP